MKTGIKVGDVMTRDFVSVSPEVSASECSKKMISKKVGSLIVKTNQHLIGILTEGDIIRALAKNKNLSKIKAKDIMTKKVVTVSPSSDLYEALDKMKTKKIRWLPITVKGRVIGMLTVKDVLVVDPTLIGMVAGFTKIKEETQKLKIIKKRKESKNSEGQLWSKEGSCEDCGAYGILYSREGKLLCESCKEDFDQ